MQNDKTLLLFCHKGINKLAVTKGINNVIDNRASDRVCVFNFGRIFFNNTYLFILNLKSDCAGFNLLYTVIVSFDVLKWNCKIIF